MARSANQRLKLLRLKQYLLENTDENHSVKVSDIISYLSGIRIDVERKTVYTDIDLLIDEEEDIIIDKEKHTGEYRIVGREFELSDLQLIIDCVQSSKFITQKYANELTEKLKTLTSKYGRTLLNRRCLVIDRARSLNKYVFGGVDEIHRAIEMDRKIKFIYSTHDKPNQKNERERLVSPSTHDKPNQKNERERLVSPITLIWHDGNYYLYTTNDRRYRVDRMRNISCVEDEAREGMASYSKSKIQEASAGMFSAFSGKQELVSIRFANRYTDTVIDRFGDKVRMIPDGEDYFTVTVKIEVNFQFYGWVFGLGRRVKILSPDWVVGKMRQYLAEVTEEYQTDTKT